MTVLNTTRLADREKIEAAVAAKIEAATVRRGGVEAVTDFGNPKNDTCPPSPDHRRPTNGDILARIEAVEKKLEHILFAFGVDDVNDPEAWRTLGREHSIVRVQRSFCEKVGWKCIWAVVTIGAVIGLTQVDKLKLLAGIK